MTTLASEPQISFEETPIDAPELAKLIKERMAAKAAIKPYQIGLRYAGLALDKHAGYINAGFKRSPAMGSVIHEITPSLSWHIKKHNLKIVADAPVYLNMPMFIEKGVGTYVFASQPGQGTVLNTGGNTVIRRAMVEGRMMFQFMF